MKLPIGLAFVRHRINRQIDPLTGRRGLELEISFRYVRIGREEYLAYIAIPQPDGLLFGLRRGANYERLRLFARVANKNGIVGPKDPGFCLAAGRGLFTRPVMRNLYGNGLLPGGMIEVIR